MNFQSDAYFYIADISNQGTYHIAKVVGIHVFIILHIEIQMDNKDFVLPGNFTQSPYHFGKPYGSGRVEVLEIEIEIGGVKGGFDVIVDPF